MGIENKVRKKREKCLVFCVFTVSDRLKCVSDRHKKRELRYVAPVEYLCFKKTSDHLKML